MIESKKLGVMVAIAVCFALLVTVIMAAFGDSETAKTARQAKYVTELFGDEVISISIIADEDDWNNMIANASAKEYIMADVVVNGVKFQSVGVRTKGNASLSQVGQSSSPERYSLHISFNEYVSKQSCFGLDELILNNVVSDSTYMKEYMSQDIMRYIGVEAPLTNYADISVNGEGFGFYVALEYYGDSYIQRVYEDKTGKLYNVKTMQMGGNAGNGGGFGAQRGDQANAPATDDWNDRADFVGRGFGSTGGTLEYTGDDLGNYSAIFENAHGTVSTADQKKVVEALKNLSEGTNLEQYFDVDGILRYFAAHTVVVNLDSYYSSMAQNYFIYERNGQISILPWDYHLSYGGFQSGSANDVVNYPIDTPVSGGTMESRPLLDALLSNEEYLARYHQYLQEIVDGYFGSGLFEETVRGVQEKIADYVRSDPSGYFSYEEIETGVDTLVQLNLLRAESIAGQLDGTIPSITEGQKADSASLVDATAVNMSSLGSMNMGGGMGGMGGRPEGEGGFPGGMGGGMPDMDAMRQAMEIIQEAGGEVTDEVKERLIELGLSEDEITMFSGIGGAMGGGGFFGGMGGFPGGNRGEGNQPNQAGGGFPENGNMAAPPANGAGASGTAQYTSVWSYVTLICALALLLIAGTVFAAKLKRNY